MEHAVLLEPGGEVLSALGAEVVAVEAAANVAAHVRGLGADSHCG